MVASSVAASGKLDSSDMQRVLGLTALVRVRFKDDTYEWKGRVSRLAESIDSKTRTIGVYVEVEDTAQGDIKVESFLMKNLFCEVRLVGRPGPETLVIPRSAIFGDKVGVVGEDDRLEIRTVTTGLVQFDYAEIKTGLKPGEVVVASDVAPAVKGMLLKPTVDEELLKNLKQEVADNGAG